MAEDKSPAAKGGDKKGAKARAAPASRNRADGVNKFESCAKDFCDNELKSSYIYSLKEEPSASAVRIFKATFSKPTPVSPAPPAVVHVWLEVKYENSMCKVWRYKVESNKHFLDDKTAFNESWFDKIVERKIAMRELVPLGDKFTGTRMTSVPVMR